MGSPTPEIWGKTVELEPGLESYYPLLGHMLDTATVAGILWDRWLRSGLIQQAERELGEQARAYLQLAAGIHDLGKCTPIFQGQLLSPRGRREDRIQLLEARGFNFPSFIDTSGHRRGHLHRHEKLGLYSLTESVDRAREQSSSCWIELVVLGHHGSFNLSYGDRRRSQSGELKRILSEPWKLEQLQLLRSVEEAVGAELKAALAMKQISDELIIMLSGLVILADRIASSDRSVIDAQRKLQRGELSLERPGDWLELRLPLLTEIFERELGSPRAISQDDILGDFAPRGVQKVYPRGRGLWLCMAPTGAGKTEAALLRHSAAEEQLTFLLPTLSTTNAMMGRLVKIYGKKLPTTAVLGHGLAFLEDFYNSRRFGPHGSAEDRDDCGLVPTDFSRVNGAKLSATINVATIDQLLMGAFPIKWSHLRWLLLSNSHIVIDEAHLLDHYQVELLTPLLKFLGSTGGRVSVLSATLPHWLEEKLVAAYSFGQAESSKATIFPSSLLIEEGSFKRSLTTAVEIESYSAQIKLTPSLDSVEDHILWARENLSLYPRARLGIFVNQVKRAQTIARELRRTLPSDVEVICLHSRMLAKHRKVVTDRLLSNLKTGSGNAERVVLVGTQVIEMSLDIDLDLISTDLCPAPSLIQRMGRSWRDRSSKERFERIDASTFPEMAVHIAVPVDSEGRLKSKELLPYRESVLQRTLDYLDGRDRLSFPSDLQDFVETVMVNPESIANRGEEDEFADSIYRTLRARDVAIDVSFLDPHSPRKLNLQQYGSVLTDSDLVDEEFATRFVESPQGEPYIMISDSLLLQDYGALAPGASLDSVELRRAQEASVALSLGMASALEKDASMEKLEIKDLRKWGYFGELPSYLSYDELVGLMIEEK